MFSGFQCKRSATHEYEAWAGKDAPRHPRSSYVGLFDLWSIKCWQSLVIWRARKRKIRRWPNISHFWRLVDTWLDEDSDWLNCQKNAEQSANNDRRNEQGKPNQQIDLELVSDQVKELLSLRNVDQQRITHICDLLHESCSDEESPGHVSLLLSSLAPQQSTEEPLIDWSTHCTWRPAFWYASINNFRDCLCSYINSSRAICRASRTSNFWWSPNRQCWCSGHLHRMLNSLCSLSVTSTPAWTSPRLRWLKASTWAQDWQSICIDVVYQRLGGSQWWSMGLHCYLQYQERVSCYWLANIRNYRLQPSNIERGLG